MDNINRILDEDSLVHGWYRFVLSFPPHLVRKYLNDFNVDEASVVLDPFCGTGTTNVECMKNRVRSIGVEANRMTWFASQTKTSLDVDTSILLRDTDKIVGKAVDLFNNSSGDLIINDAQYKLIPKGAICDLPLKKALAIKEAIKELGGGYVDYYYLALAKHVVHSFSNIRFGPELGVSKVKLEDVEAFRIWRNEIEVMANDINVNQSNKDVSCKIILGDARGISSLKLDKNVTTVITSPPYPNEKDYTRITRLESVVLDFLKDKQDLRAVKQNLLRSNTKNVYKLDDDDKYVEKYISVMQLSQKVEEKRVHLNKTSGFEKLYSRVVKLYFGGMLKHLIELKTVLKEGANLAYVVGDQSSYFQIPINTAELLGELAESVGYKVERIENFRSRFATGSKKSINEDVLILTYMGGK